LSFIGFYSRERGARRRGTKHGEPEPKPTHSTLRTSAVGNDTLTGNDAKFRRSDGDDR
jgi:hypothetical protein